MLHTFRLLVIGIALSCVLGGCSKSDAPLPQPPPTIYKENAYELNLLTQKLPDGRTVFQLNKTLYVKGKTISKMVVSLDTLEPIGKENAEVVEETDDGDVNTHTQTVEKEYDVLFRVDTLDRNRSFGFDTSRVQSPLHDSAVHGKLDSSKRR